MATTRSRRVILGAIAILIVAALCAGSVAAFGGVKTTQVGAISMRVPTALAPEVAPPIPDADDVQEGDETEPDTVLADDPQEWTEAAEVPEAADNPEAADSSDVGDAASSAGATPAQILTAKAAAAKKQVARHTKPVAKVKSALTAEPADTSEASEPAETDTPDKEADNKNGHAAAAGQDAEHEGDGGE